MPKQYNYTRISCACKRCGKHFSLPSCKVKSGEGSFCSMACYRMPRKCLVPISASIAYVPLDESGSLFALIDVWNKERVEVRCWSALRTPNNVYAQSSGKERGLLHHFVIGKPPRGFVVDHKNTNGLDDRECNLRQCTQTENMHNSRVRKNSRSGIKGISFSSRYQSWEVKLKHNGKTVYLGRHKDKEAAISIYREAATKLRGEFVRF